MKEFVENSDGVHLLLNPEFTICGDAFDMSAVDKQADDWKPTTKTIVTCERCKMIVLTCRGVRISK